MRFLISEKLGPHKYKTPEGYLVCVDAILSRTGTQEYRRCELFGDACDDSDKTIMVDRKADEVFSDKTMASFENKAICIEHPNANVNVENHNDLSVGFVRDIHRGEDNDTPVMMGTLVITDKEAVDAVESGEYKELSCGYDCDIEDEHSPQQRNIRGNHVALCKQGRAGIARIVDSKLDDMAKLSSDEINTLKVMIEGGAGKSLYNRLSWNKAHSIHLSQEEKDILHWHLTENEYLTNKEKTVIQKVLKLDSINGSVHDWLTDFEYGYRDGKLGTYDKWYRYNRKDEGKEYDMGIKKAKGEGYEIKNFIKGTGDSMKDKLLTDMDYRDSAVGDANIINLSAGELRKGMRITSPGVYQGNNVISNVVKEKGDVVKVLFENGESESFYSFATIRVVKDSIEDASQNYTFKLAKRKNDYDEFVVRAFKNGRYDEGATYYSDDWEDAVGTLKAMAKQYGLSVKQKGSIYTADATQTQDTFTVEYVKDNITHIVEVEAKTIADAVIKAKNFV